MTIIQDVPVTILSGDEVFEFVRGSCFLLLIVLTGCSLSRTSGFNPSSSIERASTEIIGVDC